MVGRTGFSFELEQSEEETWWAGGKCLVMLTLCLLQIRHSQHALVDATSRRLGLTDLEVLVKASA